ncbi:MAG: type II toxin-antitoxin system RelE/ParE family toxin [Acidobacteriia bacterium]|nr:type II toxin-antitoxin system RelE/ParE family toxin [Terriglobia bacterium]
MTEVLYTGEFEEWWDGLNMEEQDSIDRVVRMLIEEGPVLRFPYSSGVEGSVYSHMRELRIQHQGRPYRVLYAFDPGRNAVLLIGGDKTGNERWYQIFVPIADRLYAEHLRELEET